MTQLGLFDGQEDFHLLDKPIRLISLFSGYDSQALALKYLNIPFEHYKTCEWAINSIYALYDLHFNDIEHRQESLLPYDELCKFYADKISKDYSTPLTYKQVCKLGEEKLREIDFCVNNSNNLLNICYVKGKDLEIVDTEHYNYLLTYSFPCQDLSLSGSRGGMSEDSGTRSSLLWEVGRLLTECDEKPQVLLMENVPQVLEKTNIKEFGKWIDKLESLGYKSYFKVLNAKDYGVPQNRARCYMVSLYGDYKYYFPEPLNVKVQLKDVLEKEVDEKYFISKDTLHTSLTTPYWSNTLGERLPRDEDGLAHTLKAGADNEKNADLVAFDKDGNLYDSTEDKDNLIGQFENHRKWHKKQNELNQLNNDKRQGYRVYDTDGISNSITATGAGVKGKAGLYLIDTDNLEETEKEFNVWSKDGKSRSTRKLDEHGLIEFGENYCTIPNSKGNINAQNNRFYKVDRPSPNLQTGNTPQVIIDEPTAFTKRKENPNQEKLPIEVNEEQKGIVLHTGNKVLNETALKIDVNDPDVQYLDCYDRAIRKDTSCTITTRIDASNEDYIYTNYRIRKLTPMECFRLMGVKDEDYHKIAVRQTEKALYHMAGDSIVVNVLMEIFKELL